MFFPEIETERLVLTLPPPEQADRVALFFEENWEHLRPWSPPTPAGYFSEAYWQEELARRRQTYTNSMALQLFIALRDGERPFVGYCNFNQFVRGPFQACYLGYALGEKAVGQGLMLEALRAAIPHVFEHVGLHRIMANYIPTNERSGRLLRRLGFRVEGYAHDYLFIDGAWRDHILTSLTNPEAWPR